METTPGNEKIHRIIESNIEALAAIDQIIGLARKQIDIFDINLKDRGFNTPARTEVLRAFLLANRANRIRIALHDTSDFSLTLPRFMSLFKQFSGNIFVHRTTGAACEAADPLFIVDGLHFWHKLHYQHPRSVFVLNSATDAAPLCNRFEEIWDNSEPAVSAHTLGL